jgi:hypothetical protein
MDELYDNSFDFDQFVEDQSEDKKESVDLNDGKLSYDWSIEALFPDVNPEEDFKKAVEKIENNPMYRQIYDDLVKSELEMNSNIIVINDNKRKRGRKSLEEKGFTEIEIKIRRQEQNRESQQRRRDKKKTKALPETESTFRVLKESQMCIMIKALESVMNGTNKEENKNHIQFVINTLYQMPSIRPTIIET